MECFANPDQSRPGPLGQLPAKYQPLRVLGTGGMGTVLLARDKNLGRLLAVKLLRTECPDFLGRMRQEARLLARLEHPSIVRVHDLDVFAGRTYLAMEYVRGGNLALARMGPETLVRTLRGVVDALAHAHEQGIVHRDVKPENVLLSRPGPRAIGDGRGAAILTDFGLAQGPTDSHGPFPRPVTGTPLTMSPEQTNGAEVGPASDIFSFGVTLYRQLTRTWPFRGRTVGDVLDAIRHRTPAPLVASGQRVPRQLERIVMRSLAKEPSERFACMRSLGAALDGFLHPRSIFAFPHLWRRGRREEAAHPNPRIHPKDLL